MSTFGKVLLVFNLLAAGALCYFTAQDWSKRQEISGVLLRFQLTLQGLPLETGKVSDDKDDPTVPVDVRTPAGTSVERVSTKLLKKHFEGAEGVEPYGAGGTQVLSLHAELLRVEQKLLTAIENQPNDDGNLRFLVGGSVNLRRVTGEVVEGGGGMFEPGVLLRMAESYEERIAIWALYPPTPTKPMTAEQKAENVKEARARLQRRMDALKATPDPKAAEKQAQDVAALKAAIEKDPKSDEAKKNLARVSALGPPTATRDDGDRRRRIAHFLMMLDVSAAWQKRVMALTGLRTYVTALNEQILRLTDMTLATERGIERDQATFEDEYELLRRLAIKLDLLVLEETAIVKSLAEMESRDAASKSSRETQLTNLKNDLATVQGKIGAVLGRQATAEKAVFDLQVRVGNTLIENLELENKLDQAEQKKR